MSIPREFIELVLTKIDLVDLINSQVPLRKKSGSNYFAKCPFHNEKSASFSVSQTKQFYYCFGCGAHGNAIDFLMQYERLSFPEAIEALARQAGVEIPKNNQFVKKQQSLPSLYEFMTRTAVYYYDQMCKSPRAINYLKTRKITGMIAQQFSLGYAPNNWNNLSNFYGDTANSKNKLLETGLVIRKDETGFYDRFRDRIMFPIHDYRGRVIGFGGRILDKGEPKYLNSPETPLFQKGHELYGLHQSLKMHRKLERVIVVEGYMDVIALFQHGITYAVATMGTATTQHHLHRLFRYTSEIIFCFDGDEAGRTAAWRALQVIFPNMHDSLQIRFLFLPEGEDPDSLIRKEGKACFEKRISEALSLSEFFFQTLSQQADIATMEGRARLAAQALNYIKQLPESIFHEMMVAELAKRARINAEELKQQIQSSDTVQANVFIHTQHSEPGKNKLREPLRMAMALLIQNPQLVSLVKEPLPQNSLPGYSFFTQLIKLLQKKPTISTGMLIEFWRGQKEEAFMAKLAQWEHMIPESGLQNEFLGAFRQIAILGLDDEINRLLAKASHEGLSEEEKMLLSERIGKKKELAMA